MKRTIVVALIVLTVTMGTLCGVDALTPRPAGEGAARAVSEWLRGW